MAKALWYQARRKPHVCVDCGKELSNIRAKRCQECAARRERELDRARYARKKASEAKKKKSAKAVEPKKDTKRIDLKPDRGRDMDKKTFRELKTSKLRADNDRARDAMRKAAAEKRRAEAAEANTGKHGAPESDTHEIPSAEI